MFRRGGPRGQNAKVRTGNPDFGVSGHFLRTESTRRRFPAEKLSIATRCVARAAWRSSHRTGSAAPPNAISPSHPDTRNRAASRSAEALSLDSWRPIAHGFAPGWVRLFFASNSQVHWRTIHALDRPRRKRYRLHVTQKRLWDAADQLRANSGLKTQEYSGSILGLIFLRFAEVRFAAQRAKPEKANTSSRRRSRVDEAAAYHADNVLYTLLKELPKKISEIPATLGFDAFGRIYEYFLGEFAMSEGQGGGEFYTPASIVKLLTQVTEPYHGRILDPACGSGGMFVQCARFVAEHHKNPAAELSICGVEKNR